MMWPSKRTGMFSTGTCSPRIGWWMLPRTISPECRHWATSVHCDSLTVWPTRSWSTRVGRLLGRIWPSTTSSGSSSSRRPPSGSARCRCPGAACTGTRRRRSEKERSARTLQLPSSRCRCSSSSGLRSVWLSASSAGVGIRPSAPDGPGHRDRVGGAAPVALQGIRRPPRRGRPAGRRPGRPRAPAGGRPRPWSAAPRRATKRSSSPRAGYCSPTGLRQPAEVTSAAMPEATAASAIRSHHSAGASGT